MPRLKDEPLEPRGENEPKFNPKNKTDRHLVALLVSIAMIVLVIAAALIVCYYVFWK